MRKIVGVTFIEGTFMRNIHLSEGVKCIDFDDDETEQTDWVHVFYTDGTVMSINIDFVVSVLWGKEDGASA